MVPAVTSMPTVAALRLIVRPVSVYAVPPARRRPWVPELALSRTTLAVLPRAALAETCRMPAVTLMIDPEPPKVLPALDSTIAPAPALVRTTAVEPVCPPLTTPERVSPWVSVEILAVETE